MVAEKGGLLYSYSFFTVVCFVRSSIINCTELLDIPLRNPDSVHSLILGKSSYPQTVSNYAFDRYSGNSTLPQSVMALVRVQN